MIYLDNAATTQVLPEILSLDVESEARYFGNANSRHKAGYEAKKALEEARKKILNLLGGASSHRLLFTSGATESNNLFIQGVAKQYRNRGNRIITSSVEHPSVINAFEALKQEGFDVVVLPVNKDGCVDAQTLAEAMNDKTILVSIIAINNETGAINDLAALSQVVKKYPKAFFHSDITQLAGKYRIDLSMLDGASFSAHKFHGRKGVGGLLLRKNVNLYHLLNGGDQEEGLRPGTNNVAGAISMAKAFEISYANMPKNLAKTASLMDLLHAKLSELDEYLTFNSPAYHSPYVLNISLTHHKASVFIEALSNLDIYVSSVSACSSKGEPVSNVLLAMGKSSDEAGNAIRISPCELNTEEEILSFVEAISKLFKEVHPR